MTPVWVPRISLARGTWLLKLPLATFACVLVKQPVMLVHLLEVGRLGNTSEYSIFFLLKVYI